MDTRVTGCTYNCSDVTVVVAVVVVAAVVVAAVVVPAVAVVVSCGFSCTRTSHLSSLMVVAVELCIWFEDYCCCSRCYYFCC